MTNILDNKGRRRLQQDYLIAEKKEREELTKEYVDENSTWEGGFD